jgi:uncharacterized membrane protein (DUF485 family)
MFEDLLIPIYLFCYVVGILVLAFLLYWLASKLIDEDD